MGAGYALEKHKAKRAVFSTVMVMAKVDEYNMYILLLSGRSNCHACCCYHHNQYASHGCYDGDCFDNASCPPENYCNEMLTLINTALLLYL